jgi:hypothetical protein
MPDHPDREALRARTRALDTRQKKIVTALVAAMIENSHRVRDREWVSERFARTVALALGLAEDTALTGAPEAVERARIYSQEHAPTLIRTSFDIFGEVALTLQQRGGPITGDAAMAEVMTYVGEA